MYEEATEEWYAQRVPDEERNCMRLARQFSHQSTENVFSSMCSFNHQHEASRYI